MFLMNQTNVPCIWHTVFTVTKKQKSGQVQGFWDNSTIWSLNDCLKLLGAELSLTAAAKLSDVPTRTSLRLESFLGKLGKHLLV